MSRPDWKKGDRVICLDDKPGSNRDKYETPNGIVFRGLSYTVDAVQQFRMLGTPGDGHVWRVHLKEVPALFKGRSIGWQVRRFKKIT